ncbi:hypothetical protein B7C62_10315 [Kitasatospora albolonga]|uniref:Lipoprotein n=1 Tax=Kitasatospora albolonga TaxID=68173 RepID=A0ABC8BQL1_9ACTN|nr:hypothetical protein B7C62_10315 [Kitasatospora albolonga]
MRNTRTLTRAVPAALAAIALTVTLAGCGGALSDTGKSDGAAPSGSPDDRKTFRLGESSPQQGGLKKDEGGATYTVTPTKVVTGTSEDVNKSGLDKSQLKGPRVPVHVWSTLTHTGGKPMRIGAMDGDLVIRTDRGDRTKALLVMWGDVTWPNCPEPDSEKKLAKGTSEKICTTFLITRGEKPTAVELEQGFHSEPLEWPVED